jgi:hypothetical protein
MLVITFPVRFKTLDSFEFLSAPIALCFHHLFPFLAASSIATIRAESADAPNR